MLGDDPVVALREIEALEWRGRCWELRSDLDHKDEKIVESNDAMTLASAFYAVANGRRRFWGLPVVA